MSLLAIESQVTLPCGICGKQVDTHKEHVEIDKRSKIENRFFHYNPCWNSLVGK